MVHTRLTRNSIDAFQKLAKDIIDISNEFSNLPISPPGVSSLSIHFYP